MILPIVAYGDPVLKKKAADISPNYPDLQELITNMYETMYESKGVGLAAPQIGLSIRLFVTDGAPFEEEEVKDFKQVFINAKISGDDGEKWKFNEGCLSIPTIREDVIRPQAISIEFYDEQFNFHKRTYAGLAARIIQHEYDHIEGTLFIDRISSFRKRLIKNKLIDISRGDVEVEYLMRFPMKK